MVPCSVLKTQWNLLKANMIGEKVITDRLIEMFTILQRFFLFFSLEFDSTTIRCKNNFPSSHPSPVLLFIDIPGQASIVRLNVLSWACFFCFCFVLLHPKRDFTARNKKPDSVPRSSYMKSSNTPSILLLNSYHITCFHLEFFRFQYSCLLYTSPSPRDATLSRMPSSA